MIMTTVKDSGRGEITEPDMLAIDLRIAVMRTSRRLRIEATGDVITPGQYTVLGHLQTESQTLRELAELEHVQAPSMTRIVNALTEKGFATRSPHPEDGRQIQVQITESGKTVLAQARSQRTAWLAQRVASLSEKDRHVLSRAAQIMQELSGR